MSQGIASISSTDFGQRMLGQMQADDEVTIFAPMDDAWDPPGPYGNLSDPQNIVTMLSYQIVTTNLTASRMPDPPSHTIAFTLFRSADHTLPGDQTQVLVVERADPGLVVRKPDYNLTTTGDVSFYSNVVIWPTDGIIQLPIDSLDVLSHIIDYPDGTIPAAGWEQILSSTDLTGSFEGCFGCTFFVPIDRAVEAVNGTLQGYKDNFRRAVVKNHIINGTTIYTSQLHEGDTFVTSGGETIAYASNDTGSYFLSHGQAARLVRGDIPTSNGVIIGGRQ
ncbi:hypothetical protein TREMEDRAFT_74351 [Tremella mesenterica DSM 1558]|uniref:uncharacterized protein n=1 Tax=Tremella mesenterica (strain ATCC 24925 / CBS 8224 / DSM 1558 / NBRC 9311 / NRRL Y-6157 / RJB 2259-6 / UBC 559-6) TaxID=578456 RepID=UPI0003F49B62|nr:uncharacterized protein TREMEDRAFT_74351 [Tremella mesenterica DSM 1558]EIW67917.1 hypothetical protein TREMEDRAFT_74351 [Tremella mesenterica DSM 1558]